MAIKYIIVDDEPLAHELIENFCQMLPQMELAAHCYDALEAMPFLSQHTVDLMFLDLNMPKLKGFDFLRTLTKPPKIIVTTAYQEFALEGYELNIVDYLLKPFSFERFLKAVNKASATEQKKHLQTPLGSESTSQRFFVKGDKKHHQIDPDDILYIEAYGNYTKIFLEEELIISHESISSFESLLPSKDFLRIHKSFIISLSKIKTIEGNQVFIHGKAIPIGQTYRSMVQRVLNT